MMISLSLSLSALPPSSLPLSPSPIRELKVSINARIMSYTGAVGQLVKGLQKFHIFSGGESKYYMD